ncbi:uncharacterized protein LOC126999810 [Eriocheir sinensis]|uniref:uncharacterized protein LOC126999810 n=1 Tax=Eriocheir sinensis TaxID=95602 RepID=UPI0021CAD0A9|nr:uncharacterized protein LOC126999810 [Eriocheir sinensis]
MARVEDARCYVCPTTTTTTSTTTSTSTCPSSSSSVKKACRMLAWAAVLLAASATATGTQESTDNLTLFVTLPPPADDPQDTTATTSTTTTTTGRPFYTTTSSSNLAAPSSSSSSFSSRGFSGGRPGGGGGGGGGGKEDRAALLLPPMQDLQVEFLADDVKAAAHIRRLLRTTSHTTTTTTTTTTAPPPYHHHHHHHKGPRSATEEVTGRSATEGLMYPFPRRTPRPRPLAPSMPRPFSSPGLGGDGGGGSGSIDKGGYFTSSSLQARPWVLQRPPRNLTRVLGIEAECQEESMKIFVKFNGSFSGLIYSSGYAHNTDCVYVSGSGRPSYTFIVLHDRCGTASGNQDVPDAFTRTPLTVTRNTLTVQYNPLIEEVWDEHFKVTCEYDYEFRKTVTFPFMDVTVKTGDLREFTLRAPECKMEIRQGLSADGPRVDGPVRVGDPLTLVIYMTSQHENFDMVVSDCHAHNGGNKRIELIDSFGCPIDESLITGFQGSRLGQAVAQTSVFAYMKTFRFTGSRMLYLQCDVTMCLGSCPKTGPCHWRRYRRHTQKEEEEQEKDNEEEQEQEQEKEGERKEEEESDLDPASSSANMSESLRMTLEVVRDEQIFNARSDLDSGMMCLKQGTFSALAGVVAIVVGVLTATCGVLCLRLRRARKQEDGTSITLSTPKTTFSPSLESHVVPPIKRRLP